ncbi:SRPBCC domain-containing protein [Sinomonas notoginsengisoli]|uniref:SRPBCC family protein n=1 Tax=Sinomonas notoginsengisoli TaxID=1457311 RepID=UPI001F300BAA|nr:SRPBCC domain-containing protein [Sinomonas notoginsengisoli]
MTEQHPFEIVQDVVLAASPEQIWKAITEDTAAWMFPTDQWPSVRTVDEYPSHLVTRMEGPDGWFNQLEHVLTPGPEGTHLHYVHSGVLTDNWEQQYDGAAKHTLFYLHTLGQYLANFDGRTVVYVEVRGPDGSIAPDAFERFLAAFGLVGVIPGEKKELDLPVLGPVEATVDYANEYFLGLRTGDAMVRVFGRNLFGDRVGLTVHDFSLDSASEAVRASRADQHAEAWRAYLEKLYA